MTSKENLERAREYREYWIWEATGWAYPSEARAREKAGSQTVIHVIEFRAIKEAERRGIERVMGALDNFDELHDGYMGHNEQCNLYKVELKHFYTWLKSEIEKRLGDK